MAPNTFEVGGVVDSMRMVQAAWPASHRPGLSPTRGSGFGVFNCISSIAGGVVAVGAGALKSTIGLGGSLAATGALLFVASLLLLRLRLSEGAAEA